MTPITSLTDAVLRLVPDLAGWAMLRNEEPSAGMTPPWVIATASGDLIHRGETGRLLAANGRLEVRIASLTMDSVNIAADDLLIPALQGARAAVDGFASSPLSLLSDSGAYRAGIMAADTGRRYAVRVLAYRYTWSR